MKVPLTIKYKLLQYVPGFPGIAKVLQQPASGVIKACPWCEVTGTYSKTLRKTVYTDNRCFLPGDDSMRKSNSFTTS